MKKNCILFICLAISQFVVSQKSTGLIFTNDCIYEETGLSAPAFYNRKVPDKVDLSANLPPVGNQYPQNSCVGWALGYACRSYYNIKTLAAGTVSSKNPQVASPAFIYNLLNNGQNKGISINKALHLLIDTGVCSYKSMPYSQYNWKKQPSEKEIAEANLNRIDTFKRIDLKRAVANLKAELVSGNPVICAAHYDLYYFNAGYSTKAKFYRWDTIRSLDKKMGHAIVIVGYNDSLNAFKFINSWGTNWGNKGYGWINYKLAPTVIREAYIIKPRPVFKIPNTPPNNMPKGESNMPKGQGNMPKGQGNAPYGDTDGNESCSINAFYWQDTYTEEEYEKLKTETSNIKLKPGGGGVVLGKISIAPTDSDLLTSSFVEIHGVTLVNRMVCSKYEVIIRFFFSENGQKGEQILSNNDGYKLANGQVAVSTEAVYIKNGRSDFDIWNVRIPLSAFDLPKSNINNDKEGHATTKIIAEPILFTDDFPLITGKELQFEIKH